MINAAVPARTLADHERHISTACKAYNALGITSVAEPGLIPAQLRAFQNVRTKRRPDRPSLDVPGWLGREYGAE